MTLNGKRQACHFHSNRLYFADGWQEKLQETGLIQRGGVAGSNWNRVSGLQDQNEIIAYRVTLSDGETVYFKRYLLFGKPFKFYLRPNEAAVEVFSYGKMAKFGIPIAEPVTLGEIRRCGSLFAACILTRGIPETMTLKDYAIFVNYRQPQFRRQISCRHWPAGSSWSPSSHHRHGRVLSSKA